MPQFYSKKPASRNTFHQRMDSQEDPLRTLLEWNAPSRPFRAKDRSFYTNSAVVVILISLILLLMGEVLAIFALWALMFVTYALSTTPPEEIRYKITTQGFTIGEHFYPWHNLEYFWFTDKEGHRILHILTDLNFPSVLIIPLGAQNEDQLRRVLSHYLIFLEVAPRTTMDKWAEKLQHHFQFETPKAKQA